MANLTRVLIGLCVIGATFGIVYVLETNTLATINVSPDIVTSLRNFYLIMRGIGALVGGIMIVIGIASKPKKNLSG